MQAESTFPLDDWVTLTVAGTESPEGMTLYSQWTSMRYSKQCARAHGVYGVRVCQ